MKTAGATAIAAIVCFSHPAWAAGDSKTKTDLKKLTAGMVFNDVTFQYTDCAPRYAPTPSQTSGLECDDVPGEASSSISVEFTSSLTDSKAYLITYSFCSNYSPRELADSVTAQYGRKPEAPGHIPDDWSWNMPSGLIWKLDRDDLRLWLEKTDRDQCKSSEQGWELHLLSLVLIKNDKRARAEYEDAHPISPPPVFFGGKHD
jgi:hypothetical protein